MTTAAETIEEQAGGLAERLFGQVIGWVELTTVYVGVALGLYDAVADKGAVTAQGLADAAGIGERYAREWLEQQSVADILTVDDVKKAPEDRVYSISEAHRMVLTDPESPFSMIGPAWIPGTFARALPALLEAYRTGKGVPLTEYGEEFIVAQALFNRPAYKHFLADEWLAAVPDVKDRLEADPPARIVDVACGAGWSSISLAQAFPTATVDGIDLDEASIATARKNAAEAGVTDRVNFEVRDASDPKLAGRYDVAFIFEALHDMSQPVNVLAAVRGLVGEGGTVIVMDEKVQDEFTAPGDEIERFMYGASVLHCLPVGLADEPSVGTGTVLRTDTLRRYAEEAGFTSVEVLPIEADFFRFYRLGG
ncbi:MAG TPA: methyltransferase domain-containing protein [Acidimicrobiia bacterium]|nr:methyltransferase domain-containing protein [Acidimicrobiia bacterium]